MTHRWIGDDDGASCLVCGLYVDDDADRWLVTAAKEAHRTAVDAAQVPYLTAQRAYDVAVREAVMPD